MIHTGEEDVDGDNQDQEWDSELDRLGRQATHGDAQAMHRLLELIRPPVVRYCRARMGSGGVGLLLPEDVAQDVLFAVSSALGAGRYRSGDTGLMRFVYGIASNKVVDAFRAAGRDRSQPTDGLPDSPDDAAGPETSAMIRAQAAELRGLLELLPTFQREVLVLRVAMRFSAEETARTVGSTAGSVRVTQHRAMTRLRALMAERMAAED